MANHSSLAIPIVALNLKLNSKLNFVIIYVLEIAKKIVCYSVLEEQGTTK